MKVRYIILLCVCLSKSGTLFAQWTEKDSIWLKNILSGKEELKLKPEVLESIQNGTLLNTETMQPKDQMKQAPMKLPVSKDFSEYIKPTDKESKVDLLSLPPAVFLRYGLEIPPETVYKAFIVPEEIKKSGVKPSGRSFDDALKQLFSPKERRKIHNRRNANAWKNYNRFP